MKQILALTLIAFFALSIIPAVSAEIIWSLPTHVHFSTTSSGDGDDDDDDNGNGGGGFVNKRFAEDLSLESDLYDIQYGSWECINHQLQRTNTLHGQETVEFGGVCGIIMEAEKEKDYSFLLLLAFVLFIAILIVLILIIVVLLRR